MVDIVSRLCYRKRVMIPTEVKAYLSMIGRKGGRSSRRTLTTEQSKTMLNMRSNPKQPKKPKLTPAAIEAALDAAMPKPPQPPSYSPAEQAEIERNRLMIAKRKSAYA